MLIRKRRKQVDQPEKEGDQLSRKDRGVNPDSHMHIYAHTLRDFGLESRTWDPSLLLDGTRGTLEGQGVQQQLKENCQTRV